MSRERQTLASLLEIALFLIPILLLFQPSHALPLLELHIPSETGLNRTIVLPETVTNHGDSTIICLPVKWTNVIMFFTSNYLLHVGTVRSRPGDTGRVNALDACVALLFPYAGVIRGLEGLLRMPVLTRNQLQRAARAEALCVVTRDQTWTPRRGDRIMMDKRQWAARAVRVGSR